MQWSDISFAPATRTLRQFAALWLVFFGALACVQEFKYGRPALALALGVLAVTIGLLGLVRPQSMRLIYVGAMIVAFPIGWLVSRLLLAVLFYGMFTPIGLLFWALGRDVLRRRRTEQRTYWAPKPKPADAQSYFRQF
jgi:hypothetical protein